MFVMAASPSSRDRENTTASRRIAHELANRAFFRAAESPLRKGNTVRLLKDAGENYPAWLNAIGAAKRTIHFECYIIHDDEIGRVFAAALMDKAHAGVQVRVLYDWVGARGAASWSFWRRLRKGGVEVCCYNPPRPHSPLGWISRDHRKVLSVDGTRAFVAGLCVGRMWLGDPKRNREPWRDTGVELEGPVVDDVERAFAHIWAAGGSIPSPDTVVDSDESTVEGGVAVRVISTVPNTARLFRLDQMVAGLARERLWLSDAYFAGTAPYVQALRAAALDGVDVRLLVPGASDIPILQPLSRAGYRPLLDAGVRVFEWNGTMMHAKTAVADRLWSRVGSSNLNLASWLGNCELDVMVEDEPFADQMERMYLDDLRHATEIVLDRRKKLHAGDATPHGAAPVSRGGSAGRATAAALRISNAVAAAVTDSRELEPVEARLLMMGGLLLLAVAVLVAAFPGATGSFVALLAGWLAVSLLYRAYTLHRRR
jgi:cardiolipin synthase A/B